MHRPRQPFQYSLIALFGWVTFAALMFWLATLGLLGAILAAAVTKHVLVALLCMWQSRQRKAAPGAPVRKQTTKGVA